MGYLDTAIKCEETANEVEQKHPQIAIHLRSAAAALRKAEALPRP